MSLTMKCTNDGCPSRHNCKKFIEQDDAPELARYNYKHGEDKDGVVILKCRQFESNFITKSNRVANG